MHASAFYGEDRKCGKNAWTRRAVCECVGCAAAKNINQLETVDKIDVIQFVILNMYSIFDADGWALLTQSPDYQQRYKIYNFI